MNYEGKVLKHNFIESDRYSICSATKDRERIVTNKTLGVSVLDTQGFADAEISGSMYPRIYRYNLEILGRVMLVSRGQTAIFYRAFIAFSISARKKGHLYGRLY